MIALITGGSGSGKSAYAEELCLSSPTAMQASAFVQKLTPSSAMNGSIYAPAAKQAVVCCIYDCFQIVYFCNISQNSLYLISHNYITLQEVVDWKGVYE